MDSIDEAKNAFARQVAKAFGFTDGQRPFGGAARDGAGQRVFGETFGYGGDADDVLWRSSVKGEDFKDLRGAGGECAGFIEDDGIDGTEDFEI